MGTNLDDLRTACRAEPVRSEEEMIRTGETTWFMGRPTSAPEGMIALAQNEDMHTLIREADVLEVRKQNEFYLVKVSAEANILARFQRVVKARAQECDCDDSDDKEAPDEISRTLSNQGPFGPFGEPIGSCRLFIRCWYFGGQRICFWWIFCPGKVGRI